VATYVEAGGLEAIEGWLGTWNGLGGKRWTNGYFCDDFARETLLVVVLAALLSASGTKRSVDWVRLTSLSAWKSKKVPSAVVLQAMNTVAVFGMALASAVSIGIEPTDYT